MVPWDPDDPGLAWAGLGVEGGLEVKGRTLEDPGEFWVPKESWGLRETLGDFGDPEGKLVLLGI